MICAGGILKSLCALLSRPQAQTNPCRPYERYNKVAPTLAGLGIPTVEPHQEVVSTGPQVPGEHHTSSGECQSWDKQVIELSRQIGSQKWYLHIGQTCGNNLPDLVVFQTCCRSHVSSPGPVSLGVFLIKPPNGLISRPSGVTCKVCMLEQQIPKCAGQRGLHKHQSEPKQKRNVIRLLCKSHTRHTVAAK